MAYLADNRCMNQEWLNDLVDLDLKEIDVLPDMWDPHRIPVARDLTSSRLSIDMKPGGAGVVGQLIQERMDFHAYVMAPSIGAYFGRLAELLDSGVVVHDPQKGFLQAGSQNTTLFRMFPAVEWFDWTVGNG